MIYMIMILPDQIVMNFFEMVSFNSMEFFLVTVKVEKIVEHSLKVFLFMPHNKKKLLIMK